MKQKTVLAALSKYFLITLGALIYAHGVHVSEPLKDIIEALEPGVHFYWPIRMTGPKGVEYPVRYYGMQIRHFFKWYTSAT